MNKQLGVGLVLATTLVASSAAADPAFTADAPQVGAGLTYGIFTGDDEGDPPNPYNLGLNARGGYTLGMGLYLGAVVDYFFGETQEQTVETILGSMTFESTVNIFQIGAEVGYDLGLSPGAVLRPKVGIGHSTLTAETSSGGTEVSADESGLAITPGVQALLDLDGFFLSFDARYNILNIENESMDATGATVTNDFDASGFLIGAGVGAAF